MNSDGDLMDVLGKILEMRKERGWSELRLAEKSGLTQSTISSWYRKKILPSIPSLMKICDAFGITLCQFFMEETDNQVALNDQQVHLINSAAKLSPAQYDILIQFLDKL